MDEGDRGSQASMLHMQAILAGHRSRQHQGESNMLCEDCDKPIPESRRRAVPGCTKCVTCKESAELNGR